MHTSASSRVTTALALASTLLLAACASNQPLYYWGSYQPQVHSYLTSTAGPDEQILELEEGLEEARSYDLPPPPGYLAHLGILHAEKGDGDRMVHYFGAEKALYPESATFIDFLLSSKSGSATEELTQ